MVKKIRVMLDYKCYPVWLYDEDENIVDMEDQIIFWLAFFIRQTNRSFDEICCFTSSNTVAQYFS